MAPPVAPWIKRKSTSRGSDGASPQSSDESVKPVTGSLTATSKRIDVAGKELEKTLVSLRELIDPDAPIAVDLRNSLDELQRAASSIHSLADELDRNPSSLVFGREDAKTKEAPR